MRWKPIGLGMLNLEIGVFFFLGKARTRYTGEFREEMYGNEVESKQEFGGWIYLMFKELGWHPQLSYFSGCFIDRIHSVRGWLLQSFAKAMNLAFCTPFIPGDPRILDSFVFLFSSWDWPWWSSEPWAQWFPTELQVSTDGLFNTSFPANHTYCLSMPFNYLPFQYLKYAIQLEICYSRYCL